MKSNVVKKTIKKFEEELIYLKNNEYSKEVISDEVLLYCFKKAIKKSRILKKNNEYYKNKRIKSEMFKELVSLNEIFKEIIFSSSFEAIRIREKRISNIKEIISFLNTYKEYVKGVRITFGVPGTRDLVKINDVRCDSLFINKEDPEFLSFNDLNIRLFRYKEIIKKVQLNRIYEISFFININEYEENITFNI
jgi:hypothetical protein